MIVSRVTTKAQTTLPRPVRAALGIRPGDSVAYEIAGDIVTLKRIAPSADAFVGNFATFHEWASDADREGYADL